MKIIKRILPLFGIFLLVYVINKIGVLGILKSLKEANYFMIFLGTLFFIPMLFISAAKWNLILKKQGVNLKFSYLLKIQIISLFYEFITPARIGSFIKIAYLQERLKNFGKSANSVVIDRFLDFLSVSFLALIGSTILLKNSINSSHASMVVFFLFFLGFLVLTNKKLSRILWNIAYKVLIPKNFKERAMNSFNEFYKVLPNLWNILLFSLVTLLFWIMVYTQAYLFALGFNVNVPYLEFIFIFPISVIISLIPVTVSGLGTREASLLALLSRFGSGSSIVSFSLLWTATSVIIYSVPALYLLFRKKI